MTKHFAVLGSPIAHSKSPHIHSFVFSKANFDADYERFELAEDLQGFLADHDDFSGFSLTMPLKEQAFEIAESLDADAQATEAVNTLLRTDSGWAGFNTDVAGIRGAVGFDPTTVAVIGSGATARSALQAFPNSKRLIYARNTKAAELLAEKFAAELADFDKALEAELLISTVPTGVLPELLQGRTVPGVLLDCVYTNPELPAKKYLSGVSMLVHQAMIQQRIFQTGDALTPINREQELVSELLALLSMAK